MPEMNDNPTTGLDPDARQEAASKSEKSRRWRTAGSAVLVVLAVLLITAAVPTYWLKTTILDTEQWVATTAPLSESPEIQQAVADQVSAGLIDALDSQKLAETYLPEGAQPLAAPIASAVDSFIERETDSIISSPSFSSLWASVCRGSHPAVVTVFTGTSPKGVVLVDSGAVELNLDEIADEVGSALESKGFDRLASIPADRGTIVLFSSPALAQAQSVFNALQGSLEMILLLIPVLAALAIALAPQKRKTVLWLGLGTFIAMVLSLVLVNAAQTPLVNSIPGLGSGGKAAASSFYSIVADPLLAGMRGVGIAGIAIALIALAVGYVMRSDRVREQLGSFSHRESTAPFFQFVNRHRLEGIIGGFVVAGIILLIWFQGSFGLIIGVVIGLVIWTLLISGIAAIARIEPSEQGGQEEEGLVEVQADKA